MEKRKEVALRTFHLPRCDRLLGPCKSFIKRIECIRRIVQPVSHQDLSAGAIQYNEWRDLDGKKTPQSDCHRACSPNQTRRAPASFIYYTLLPTTYSTFKIHMAIIYQICDVDLHLSSPHYYGVYLQTHSPINRIYYNQHICIYTTAYTSCAASCMRLFDTSILHMILFSCWHNP